MKDIFGWDYPPGVTGNEPQIVGADSIEVAITCRYCLKDFVIVVGADDYEDWSQHGQLIQRAFPYLSVDERELFISQVCGECWDREFGDEEAE